MLRSIGQNPTEDEILGLVIEYDVNGDGTIDFDEFIQMMSKVNNNMPLILLTLEILICNVFLIFYQIRMCILLF